MKVFARNFWLLMRPVDDVPGQWVGHCLELDIMSVGDSLQQAIEMTSEAMCECIVDDLMHGRSPLERQSAPPEYTTELNRVLSEGRQVTQLAGAEFVGMERGMVALQFRLELERVEGPVYAPAQPLPGQAGQIQPHPRLEQLPSAWLMAQFNSQRRAGAAC
ncbi:MAG: hypothetical protein RL685_4599 [Pseudomonadota bacterium]|jgi:predicted RNase H-like HicB family nuclease